MDSPPKKRKAVGESPTAHKTIEKRRRDRINTSLNVLRTVVPAARKNQGVKHDKVELLKMTIEYLQEQQTKGFDSRSVQSGLQETETQMRLGIEDCITDVGKFLMEMEGMQPNDPTLVNLLAHLRCWALGNVQNLVEQFLRGQKSRSSTVPLAHDNSHLSAMGAIASSSGMASKIGAGSAGHVTSVSGGGRGHASVPVLTSPVHSQVGARSAASHPALTRSVQAVSQMTSPVSMQRVDMRTSSPSSALKSAEYSSGLDLISTVSSMAVEQPTVRVSSEATAPVQSAVTQRPVSVLLQQPASAVSGAFPVVQQAAGQTVTVVPAGAHTLVAPPPMAVSNQSNEPLAQQQSMVQGSAGPARLPTVYIHPASVLAAGPTHAQMQAPNAGGWGPGGGMLGQSATSMQGTGNLGGPQVLANQPMHMTALPIAAGPTGGYLSFWPSAQPTAYIAAPAVASSSAPPTQPTQWQQ